MGLRLLRSNLARLTEEASPSAAAAAKQEEEEEEEEDAAPCAPTRVGSFFYCCPNSPRLFVSKVNGQPTMVICRHPLHAATVGMGAFALRDFKRGQVITVFVGETVREDELDGVRAGREQYSIQQSGSRHFVDPFGVPPHESSCAHFINTCGGPLASVNNAVVAHGFQVVATKDIRLYEEILIEYKRRV